MTEPHDTRTRLFTNDYPAADASASVSNVESSAETSAPTVIRPTSIGAANGGSPEPAKSDFLEPPLSGNVDVGSRIGPYQLVRKLGQGGMGAVYEARHTKLKKTVAVKVLPPEMMKSPAAIARFEREMAAVGGLDHPHIVRAMDAGEFQGTHYLAMEYVEGVDLAALIKQQGVLSVMEACRVIQQAALGLQHAHEHGLVHRDIKPSNLFLTKGGQVKLLDLGLARLGQEFDENSGLTSSGQMLGTPDYMAPEQWDDTHSVDARADLYSLGCTLGFLLTGKVPFAGDKPRPLLQIMKAHADATPPDLTIVCESVPAELNAIFQRLLAKKPEDRFQSATKVATALECFTRHDALPMPDRKPVLDTQAIADSESISLASTRSFTPTRPEPPTSTARAAPYAPRESNTGAAREPNPVTHAAKPPGNVPIPTRFTVTDDGRELRIRCRWFEPSIFLLVLVAIPVDCFVGAWFWIAFHIGFKAESGDIVYMAPILLGVIPLALAVWMTYLVIAVFLNTSELRIADGRLSVRHGPVPYWSNVDFLANDVQQVFCKEKPSRIQNGPTRYQVWAVVADQQVRLVQYLSDADQAFFIKQRIERILQIEDQPVPGELTS